MREWRKIEDRWTNSKIEVLYEEVSKLVESGIIFLAERGTFMHSHSFLRLIGGLPPERILSLLPSIGFKGTNIIIDFNFNDWQQKANID
jgi:hypothetical protein